jgi:hypothetical protein
MDASQRTLDRLKALGFEMLTKTPIGNIVVGRIALDRLQRLADLDCVRYVAPQPR